MSSTTLSPENGTANPAGAPLITRLRLPAMLRTAQGFWGLIGGMTILSFLLNGYATTPDVSWLTDMCVRMLQGEQAYVDIFETTPPVPTLLYMPGAMSEVWLGIDAEPVNTAICYLMTLFPLWLSSRLLPAQLDGIGSSLWHVILPVAVFSLFLTAESFAQREYYSALLTLPMLAIFVTRLQTGDWPPAALRGAGMIACGVAVAIKPPLFALPVMMVAAWYLWRTRRVRFVWSSGLILAAGVSVLLTGLSLAAFPEYLGDMRLLMSEVYVPIRDNPIKAFKLFSVIILFALGVVTWLGVKGQKLQPVTILSAIMAVGYHLVFIYQGKFFAYHILPAAMFAGLALWTALWPWVMEPRDSRMVLRPTLAAITLGLMSWITVDAFNHGKLRIEDLSWAEGLEEPTAMGLTTTSSISFPLARQVNARWIDRIHSQWVTKYTHVALGEPQKYSTRQLETFRRWQETDMSRTIALVHQGQPDIIFECVHPRCNWMLEMFRERDPDLFAAYDVVAEEKPFRIWRRRADAP